MLVTEEWKSRESRNQQKYGQSKFKSYVYTKQPKSGHGSSAVSQPNYKVK